MHEEAVKIQRRSDRVKSMVLMFGEEIVICVYGPHSRKTMAEKQQFYDELECEWNLKSNAKMLEG